MSANQRKAHRTQRLHVDINLVEGDTLNLEGFKAWRPEFANAKFILDDDGTYTCGHEVEKMSKSNTTSKSQMTSWSATGRTR